MANETFSGLTNLRKLGLSNNKNIAFFSRDIIFPKPAGEANSMESLEITMARSNFTSDDAQSSSDAAKGARDTPLRLTRRITTSPSEQKSGVSQGELHESASGDLGMKPTAYFPFTGLTSLMLLRLSGNQIRSLVPEIFSDLTNMRELVLSDNQIDSWYIPILTRSNKLQKLYLDQNSITALTEAMVTDFAMNSLEVISLGNNKLVCNCSLSCFNDTLDFSIFRGYSNYVCSEEGKYYNVSAYIEMLDCPTIPGNTEGGGDPAIDISRIVLCVVGISVFLILISMLAYKRRW